MEEGRELRVLKSEKTLRELSDSKRKATIRLMPTQEEKDKEKKTEKFSNLGKKLHIQVHEFNKTPYYLNAKRHFPRHTKMKRLKIDNKERILKVAGEKRQ